MDYILLLIRRFVSLFFKIPFLEKLLLDRNGILYRFRFYFSPKTFKQKKSQPIRKVYGPAVFDVDLSQVMGWKIYYELEKDLVDLVRSYLQPDMTCIDAGANVGFYSILLGIHLSKGTVHSFEPDPESYKRLQNNIRLNGLENIQANNIGLGDQSGEYSLKDADPNNIGARYITTPDSKGLSLVRLTTLDDYVSAHHIEKVDFIKIDVEGFEVFLLNGSQKTIQENKPILLIEVSDINLKRSGYGSNKLLDKLKMLDYSNYIYVQKKQEINFNQDYSGAEMDVLCLP